MKNMQVKKSVDKRKIVKVLDTVRLKSLLIKIIFIKNALIPTAMRSEVDFEIMVY